MGHLGVVWSHGAPVPSHCIWPQSHLTQSMCRSPRIGNQDTQCAPSKVTTRLRWRIHFRAGVGVGPAAYRNIFGAPGVVIRHG